MLISVGTDEDWGCQSVRGQLLSRRAHGLLLEVKPQDSAFPLLPRTDLVDSAVSLWVLVGVPWFLVSVPGIFPILSTEQDVSCKTLLRHPWAAFRILSEETVP